jgi:hypothetical protein
MSEENFRPGTRYKSATLRERSANNMALQRRLNTAITTKNASLFLEQEHQTKAEDPGEMLQKDDELHEIGSQLVMLKKRHDYSRNASTRREANLNSLRHDQEELELLEKNSTEYNNRLREKQEELAERIKAVKSKHEQSKFERKVYLHLLERMK